MAVSPICPVATCPLNSDGAGCDTFKSLSCERTELAIARRYERVSILDGVLEGYGSGPWASWYSSSDSALLFTCCAI